MDIYIYIRGLPKRCFAFWFCFEQNTFSKQNEACCHIFVLFSKRSETKRRDGAVPKMKTKKKQRKNKENKNKTKTKRKQQEIEHPKTHLYKSIVLKHVLQTRFEQNTFSKQNESIFKQNNVLVDPCA